MTRINTNVSSLNAQKTLTRSHASLQQALTRLSTGLRINSGKDDPAGLIASEVLRSDMISVQRAVSNAQRANQMITTADSALGQVSSLLNDIRGLITEAANRGTMSDAQIAANQLQIDSSLDAIDRIASTTQFQGRRLLDSNLDFITKGVDETLITDLEIDQANFGQRAEIPVAVDVVTQGTRGQLDYASTSVSDRLVLEVGGREGFEVFDFAAGTNVEDMASAVNLVSSALGVRAEVQQGATAGRITASSLGADNDFVVEARAPGELEGNYRLKLVANPPGGSLSIDFTEPAGGDPGTITVHLQTQAWLPAGLTVDDSSAPDNELSITSLLGGEVFNDVEIVADGTVGHGSEAVSYDHGLRQLTLRFASGLTTAAEMITAFNSDPRVSRLFRMDNAAGSGGTGTLDAADAAWDSAVLGGGLDGGAVLSTAAEVVDAINGTALLSDAVQAAVADGNDGDGVVSPFAEYAFYGDRDLNHRLQFLAPRGTTRIRFATEPDQTLGVDLSTEPTVEDFSTAIIQGTAADTSIRLTACHQGAQYDGATIRYIDTGAPGQDAVVWDPESKVLDIYVQRGAATADQVVNLINNDDYAGSFFQAENLLAGGGTGTIADADFGVPLATAAGGISDPGTIIINLAADDDGVVTTTAQDLVDYFNDDGNLAFLAPLGVSVSNAEGSDGSGLLTPTSEDLVFATSGTNMVDQQAAATLTAVNGTNALIQITALEAGAEYGGVTVAYEDTAFNPGEETVHYDPVLKVLTIGIDLGATTADHVIEAINTDPDVGLLFVAQRGTDRAGVTGDGTGLVSLADGGTLSAGVADVGTEDGAALVGNDDSASVGLSFLSTGYGSDAFVSVKVLQGGPFSLTDPQGHIATRSVGTDIDARINGIQAIGRGLQAAIHSSVLDLVLTVSETVEDGGSTAFTIIGGGAQFQLGPDVITNQQARMGIAGVNIAELGGISGRLFELKSGGPKALDADVAGAASVVDEVSSLITTLRGRLGAFQRTTLETNINALSDTLESLTDAESSIRDADFAAETAQLTRAQILVESGLSVLKVANNNPQSVLRLLQG